MSGLRFREAGSIKAAAMGRMDWPLILLIALAVWLTPMRSKYTRQHAFTFTFVGLLLLVTGVLGYELPGVQGLHPMSGIVWSQIRLAIVCGLAAAIFWRRFLQTV